MTDLWVTGAPPRADWNVIASATGTPRLRFAARFNARTPAAVGLIVNVTGPAPETAFEPLPNVSLGGRHLPRLICPTMHLVAREANTPYLPFANLASHLKMPASATDMLTVMVPLLASKLAVPWKPLLGKGVDTTDFAPAAPTTDTEWLVAALSPVLSLTLSVTAYAPAAAYW